MSRSKLARPIFLVAGVFFFALVAGAVAMRIERSPIAITPLAPIVVDLCADRRPDGTLPAVCALDPNSNASGNATLLFAGDTGEVDDALPLLDLEGFDYPYEGTAPIIRDADLAVANLETPITDGGESSLRWRKYSYRAPPESALALARAGFDVVGLANNHAMDRGGTGLVDTLFHAGAAGLFAVGAGRGEGEARRALIVRMPGLRVGIIARCEWQMAWDLWLEQYAWGSNPGVALLDEKSLAADIARLRPDVDLVVVLAHWGDNYAPPTGSELRWAHRVAELGADLIVGHHPHVPQPLLLDGKTPIALSLGNYAFGSAGHPDLRAGLLMRVVVRARRIARVELLPLDVQNRRVRFKPVPLVGDDAHAALSPLLAAAKREGVALQEEGDRAVLDLERSNGFLDGKSLLGGPQK